MSSLPIKYRPCSLDEVYGNEGTVAVLRGIFGRPIEKIHHSFMLSGPSGTGKTTLARIIKTKLGCSNYDYYEINAADFRKIDDMRAVITEAPAAPLHGPTKIYHWDEIHAAMSHSKEAMLKILEEPPKHTYFILSTTMPEKIPKTIQTRCSQFHTKSLPNKTMMRLLLDVIKREKAECKSSKAKKELDLPPDTLKLIVTTSDGSARKALTLLDSLLDVPDKKARDESVQFLADNSNDTHKLCQTLLGTIYGRADWADVRDILKVLDADPDGARMHILNYMGTVLLNKSDPKIFELMTYFTENFYDAGKAGLYMSCFAAVHK